ncbi:hypothetical protein GCM10027343_25350 [Noviherbaspirillum agri]
MPIDELVPIILKSVAVGLLLGGVAYKMKQRSFFLWAGIGAVAAAIFPGLSLVALMVLAFLPNGPDRRSGPNSQSSQKNGNETDVR